MKKDSEVVLRIVGMKKIGKKVMLDLKDSVGSFNG